MQLFPEFQMLIAFLGACLILQTAPGPDMMLAVNNNMTRGTQSGLLTVYGIGMGGLLQAPLLAFGTVSLMAANAFDVLRAVGAAYLGFLAYKNVRAFLVTTPNHGAARSGGRANTLLQGFVTNVTNPKVMLFLFAFVPQFTAPEKGHIGLQLLILLGILKVNGILVNGSVAVISGHLKRRIADRPARRNWGELLSAIAFTAIALHFGYQIATS